MGPPLIPNTVHVTESIQSCQYVESMTATLVDQIFLISEVIMLQTWSVTRSSKKQKTTLKLIPNQQGETRNKRKIANCSSICTPDQTTEQVLACES